MSMDAAWMEFHLEQALHYYEWQAEQAAKGPAFNDYEGWVKAESVADTIRFILTGERTDRSW